MVDKTNLTLVSLFSGCGGLDLGFENAGFKLIYANEYDKSIWETFEKNHKLQLDKRSIIDVKSSEIPWADGIVGGPPCQSWSLAGSMKGINDKRGKLFYEYIRILKDIQPLFFVAENVPGIISSAHIDEFNKIIIELEKTGYNITWKLVNASNYDVPEERKRVIIVGFHKLLGIKFDFPNPNNSKITLKDAIGNLPPATAALSKNKKNLDLKVANHEYALGTFSSMYMSRNRKRTWDEISFTIQAGGRHAPIYPGSSDMIKIEEDKWEFIDSSNVRRLSVRECARIQTFPDDFIFYYNDVLDGYKMIGNAVPVKLAQAIASAIHHQLVAVPNLIEIRERLNKKILNKIN